MDYFNNIVEAPVAPLPDPVGPLDETGLFEAAGKGFLRGATDIGGFVTLAAGGLVGLMEGGAFKEGASDKVFKFYEDFIEPAQAHWTPDPESVSMAGNIVGGIASIAPSLMLGPGAIPSLVGTSTFGTAVDLIEQGVDPKLATGIGIFSGVTTGFMVKIPASGRTIAESFGLALTNPIIGALQTHTEKKVLEIAGHPDIAKAFNPFDPTGRSIDLALGVIFGGMGHYGRARARLPVQLNDAVDTATEVQAVTKSDIVKGENRFVHESALNDSITKLVNGDKADVVNEVQGVEFKATTPDADAMAIRKGHKEWLKDLPEEGKDILETVDPGTDPILSDSEITRESPVEGTEPTGEASVGLEPERGVGGQIRAEGTPLGAVPEALSTSVDGFVDSKPETLVFTGLDEAGEPVTQKARQYIDDAKAEVDVATKKQGLYEMAAECLMRG